MNKFVGTGLGQSLAIILFGAVLESTVLILTGVAVGALAVTIGGIGAAYKCMSSPA
jgi:hypothetical protein